MADRYMLLRPGVSTVWDHDWVMDYYSDGYWQKGISKSYTKLSSGQYSGQTNIVVAGATDEHTNAVVKDNRTGLMWSAGYSCAVGPGADGLLYWDDHCDVIEYSTCSTIFSTGDLITQANTTLEAEVRYKYSSTLTTGSLAIINPSSRPFSTAAADTVTGAPSGGGTISISTYHVSSKEDIWEYCKAANESSLSSHSDWRVPNIFELITLLDLSSVDGNGYPSTVYFDASPSTHTIWSATMKTEDSNYVYGIRFVHAAFDGSASLTKSFYPDTGRVRLVRTLSDTTYPCKPLKTDAISPNIACFPDDAYYQIGQPRSYNVTTAGDAAGNSSWSDANGIQFQISNGIVEDLNTGLMWTQGVCIGSTQATCAYVYYYDRYGQRTDALKLIRMINEQQVGGYSDWRIPNIFEALSICNTYYGNPSSVYFEQETYPYFTSTPVPTSTGNIFRIVGNAGWGSGFAKIATASTGGWAYVRAVRGGYTDADL